MRGLCISLLGALLAGGSTTVSADSPTKNRVQAFAKLPDWSGIWEEFNIGPSGFGGDKPTNEAIRKAMVEQAHPPYNAEWQAKLDAAFVAARAKDAPPPPKFCLSGFPLLAVWTPLMFQVMVTPEMTAFIYNMRETRRVLTDGSSHPPADELFANPWGDSVGRWEGHTLVIDTIGTSNGIFGADKSSLVFINFSDKVHFIERVRLIDRNTLENSITIEDPGSLTQPWTLTRQYHRVIGLDRVVEAECTGNDRNPEVDGKLTISP